MPLNESDSVANSVASTALTPPQEIITTKQIVKETATEVPIKIEISSPEETVGVYEEVLVADSNGTIDDNTCDSLEGSTNDDKESVDDQLEMTEPNRDGQSVDSGLSKDEPDSTGQAEDAAKHVMVTSIYYT